MRKIYNLAFALGALAVLIVALPAAEAGHSSFVYTLEQGALSQTVTPVVGALSAADYYDYDGTFPFSADTGLETSQTSLLFLYEDPAEELSLFVVHDKANDGTGGRVNFDFTGVPVGTTYIVSDEPGEPSLPTSNWVWIGCCTDGGVLNGTLDQSFSITIDPEFISGITDWDYHSGNGDVTALDLTEPVTLTACEVMTEVCDGVDNDCDGEVDETDDDDDGVADCGGVDLCLGTSVPEAVPTSGKLNPNHHANLDGDASFEVGVPGKNKDPIDSDFTMADTGGCSCEQILDAKPGKNKGEYKYGCTPGTMQNWIDSL